MTTNIFKSLACLVIILIKEGQPLECWSCSSASDPSCGDPFRSEDPDTGTKLFLMDCDRLFNMTNNSEHVEHMKRIFGANSRTFCRKIILTIYGTTIVQRGCSFGEGNLECDNHDPNENCRSVPCYEDACNAAATYDRVVLLVTPIVLLSQLRFYK